MVLEEGMGRGARQDEESGAIVREVQGERNIVLRDFEQDRDVLLGLATLGNWSAVLKKLQGSRRMPLLLPMNSSGDTPAHLAAAAGETEVVGKLLLLIEEEGKPEHEKLSNNSGNNPLHLAATMGHEETCRCIAEKVPELARARNDVGETPIFVAALGGHKEVFLTLTSLSSGTPEIALARRNDGDTILHCAVSAEYFDLANDILEKYEGLIYYRNERGLTPLHLLANNPSAFRSGSQLGLLDRFFYYTIEVSAESKSDHSKQQKQKECRFKLPANYSLCWSLFNLWSNIFATVGQTPDERGATSGDCETPEHPVAVAVKNFFRPPFRFLLEVWFLVLAILFGFSGRITKMRKKKKKHVMAKKVMKQLVKRIDHWWEFGEINIGMDPGKHMLERIRGIDPSTPPRIEETEHDTYSTQKVEGNCSMRSEQCQKETASSPPKQDNKRGMIESPFLIAGKKGVTEMVEAILKKFNIAIDDVDFERKNIIHLAVEHRQPEIYKLVLDRKTGTWLGKVDAEGNTVLHLAAKHPQKRPLVIPGPALQMQREIKWFKYVKESMPPHFSKRLNYNGQTAMEVFTETHQDLATQRAKWLGSASQSCSVVSTLITTVAFATIASVPGGLLDYGNPVLQGKLAFSVFSVSSLFALCFSAVSVIMFLGILTSPYQDLDFGNDLPRKLIWGMASLFISIAAMFISFFSGDLFVLERRLRYLAYPIFILTLGVTLPSFPFYLEFIGQTFTDVPKRTYPHKLSF